MTRLDSRPSPPLTDREVAKLLTGTMGVAVSFGTDTAAIQAALEWCVAHWPELAVHLDCVRSSTIAPPVDH